jgi:hypothetical protein
VVFHLQAAEWRDMVQLSLFGTMNGLMGPVVGIENLTGAIELFRRVCVNLEEKYGRTLTI